MMDKVIFVELLTQHHYKAVRSILDVMNEVDIASLLSDLDDRELALAFRLIPKDKAAEVFANMNNSMQTYLVEMFTEKELKELLDDLYMDDTVDLLEELPANLVTRILDTVSHSERNMINLLLNYPDEMCIRDRRKVVLEITDKTLQRLDAYHRIKSIMKLNCDILHIGSKSWDLSKKKHIYLLGAGKACNHMARCV